MAARGTSKKDALAARMRAVTNASNADEEVRTSADEEVRRSADPQVRIEATSESTGERAENHSSPTAGAKTPRRRAKPENRPAAAPRTTPVRITVAMPPVDHRRLKTWCASTAAELELPIVAGAEVLRILWNMTQTDPDLAARLKTELARTGGSQRQ